MPRPPPVLQIDSALGWRHADKRLEILRRVGEAGSISQAAREAGVSYKAAWQALDTLSNLAGAALVERAVGGAGGGGARLTPAGLRVLAAAGALAAARDGVLARLEPPAAATGSLAALPLRTSMRNQLPAQVGKLRRQGGAVDVELRLAGDAALWARITRESAQLLGLAEGHAVLALCKATAVEVLAAGDGAPNELAGTVRRAPRGRAGGEVSLMLAGGLHCVGFAVAGVALKAGDPAVARVAPAALVVALVS